MRLVLALTELLQERSMYRVMQCWEVCCTASKDMSLITQNMKLDIHDAILPFPGMGAYASNSDLSHQKKLKNNILVLSIVSDRTTITYFLRRSSALLTAISVRARDYYRHLV